MLFLASADLEHQITSLAIRAVFIAAVSLIVLTILAVLTKDRAPKLKLPIFIMMATAMVGTTLFLMGSTVYLNMKSESGGPVHWHTDIEFWACGAELELRDPTGFLSNKIGSSTYHEHNDKRIHLEGVVVRKSYDASLEKFMEVTGGYVNSTGIAVPLNSEQNEWFAQGEKIDGDATRPENIDLTDFVTYDGEGMPVAELKNGRGCGDSSEPAEVQAFVYRFNKGDNTYIQEKLDDPARYIMRDESVVPPGDCLIVEYNTPRDTTDKLCEQFGVRDATRCTEFGVKEYNPELCNIREITGGAQ